MKAQVEVLKAMQDKLQASIAAAEEKMNTVSSSSSSA
jgi:hypothetical protein